MLGQALRGSIFLLIPLLLRRAWQGPSKPLFLLFRFPGALQNGNMTQAPILHQSPPSSALPSHPYFGTDTMLVWGGLRFVFITELKAGKYTKLNRHQSVLGSAFSQWMSARRGVWTCPRLCECLGPPCCGRVTTSLLLETTCHTILCPK